MDVLLATTFLQQQGVKRHGEPRKGLGFGGGRNGEVNTLSRSNSNHTTKDVHNGGPSLSPENCEIKEFKDHQLETRVTPHDPFSIK